MQSDQASEQNPESYSVTFEEQQQEKEVKEELDFDEPPSAKEATPEKTDGAADLNSLIEEDNFALDPKATTMEIQWGGFNVNRFEDEDESDQASQESDRDDAKSENSADTHSERSESPQKQPENGVKVGEAPKKRRKRNRGAGGQSVDAKQQIDDGFASGGFSERERFVIKNGCCRECMKAFSKQGKACLCQVPRT